MIKKSVISVCVILLSNFALSQNFKTKNIIVNKETLEPISNVNIYNTNDNTISNNDGKFVFNSNIDTIIISHLGFEKIVTNFNHLSKNDSVFLKSSIFELKEVVVSDKEYLIKKVYKNVATNYPFIPFGDEFFIRCVLRKNKKIIKLQDIVFDMNRNSLFTTPIIKQLEYDVQILNLRKAGIVQKSIKEEEFELLSVSELFNWYSAIFTDPKHYNYYEEHALDDKHSKISFTKKESFKEFKSIEGFYIINNDDFSFNRVYYNTIFDDISKIPFNEKNNIKWRTIANELQVDYKKNIGYNKYYINNGNLKNIVEVINGDEKSIYEATYQIISTKRFADKKIKSNFSSKKDLFMANYNFNIEFWLNQNQLILDSELIEFVNSLDDYKKKYLIYSNFHK